MDVSPAAARDSSNLTLALTVAHVREQSGEGGVDRLLALAGETRPLGDVEDTSRWSSQEQKVALFRAAGVVLDDPDVSYRIGETAAHAGVSGPLRLLLRTLGGPSALARAVPRAGARFSSNYESRTVSSGPTEAVISLRILPGHQPDASDCRYTWGLLTQISVVFGLPPAQVTHLECQVRGAPACVYQVRWRPYHRFRPLGRRRARVEMAGALSRRTADFESTMADLVSADGVDVVLQRIVARAAKAVNVPRFVLAVRDVRGRVLTYGDGMGTEETARLGLEILDAGPIPAGRLVVDVASARRTYGRLAALTDDVSDFFDDEEELLRSYARQAAVALDVATSLEQAGEREAAAGALLHLARVLVTATSSEVVVERLAGAVPTVIGGEISTVLLWRAEEQVLRVEGRGGTLRALGSEAPLTVHLDDTPALGRLLAGGAPEHHHCSSTDDAYLRALLESWGQEEVVLVPISDGGRFLGLITVSRSAEGPTFVDRGDLVPRMAGLADQGAVALEKLRLLDQERAVVARLRIDEERTRHLAYHDALTGLPNARYFGEALEAAITEAADGHRCLGLLFCDLDRFKKVNDSMGHGAGDELLRMVGRRIGGVLRPGAVLGRLGGDEFAVLVPDLRSDADVAALGHRIVAALAEPFTIDGQPVYVAGSIGAAAYPDDGTDTSSLFKNADTAMYAAKRAGSGHYARYAPLMNAGARGELTLEGELHEAVVKGELTLHYQPQMDRDGHVVAVEALVRWPHPERGLLTPGAFLPLAEETDLIVDLDRWVLGEACRQAKAWDDAGLSPVRMAVNLSARSFSPAIVRQVSDALIGSGLSPDRLEVELTETVAVTQIDIVAPLLVELARLGTGLALDDFGTGYSSLGRLKDLVFHRLKIDRSFVAGLPDERMAAVIVESIMSVAHTFGVQVVAEGIEEDRQADFLAIAGCDLFQGYLLARPAPAAAIAARLAIPQTVA